MKSRSASRMIVFTVLAMSLAFVVDRPNALASSIDFADGSWNGAHGLSSYTAHPSGIDLFAAGGVLTVNYSGGPSGDNSGIDGLGINDDEITQGGTQQLKVAFAAPVTLNYVHVTDLFLNEGPANQPEVGWYSLNGGAFTSFTSVGGTNGALTLNINQSGISSILFRSGYDGWSDFSIRGIGYQAIPIPSTLLLFGAGFVGLMGWLRRERNNIVTA